MSDRPHPKRKGPPVAGLVGLILLPGTLWITGACDRSDKGRDARAAIVSEVYGPLARYDEALNRLALENVQGIGPSELREAQARSVHQTAESLGVALRVMKPRVESAFSAAVGHEFEAAAAAIERAAYYEQTHIRPGRTSVDNVDLVRVSEFEKRLKQLAP